VLRKFNFKQGEWDVVPLDQEIVAQYDPSSLVWYDAVNRQLHVPFQWQVNDGVKKIRHTVGELDERAWVLDLPERVWREEGDVNTALPPASSMASALVYFQTTKGLVLESLNQLLFVDYFENKLNQTGINQITQTLNRNSILYDLNFMKGDTIYYFNSQNGKEDLVYIGNLPVMESTSLVKDSNPVSYYAVGLLALAAGCFLIFRGRRVWKMKPVETQMNSSASLLTVETKRSEFPEQIQVDAEVLQPAESSMVNAITLATASPFNATEKEVILLCLQRSEAGGHVDLEEINHVLGIKNKSKGLQKKVRSEIFNSINNKFRTFSNTPSGLIESVRNKNDKRYFDYFIEPEHFSAVRKLLHDGSESRS
jgi:hypothetical protein